MRKSVLVVVLTAITLGGACTDPVRDREIAELGPEDPEVPIGAEHRPGQPCLHCHSEGGPAENKAFAMAGTIYKTDQPDSEGAEGVTVGFVDATGGAPVEFPQTGLSGNFYVPLADWPNIRYPVRVALYAGNIETDEPTVKMNSLIGREGSCNFCHRPNVAEPNDDDIEASRSSAGQIYLQAEPPQ